MQEQLSVELSEAARRVIAYWEFEVIQDEILKVVRPRIEFQAYFEPPANSAQGIPGTFLGGFPQMPDGLEWPRYRDKCLPFVAQIDLATVPPLPNNLLPTSGILYFFFWATNETRENPSCVVWADADAAALSCREIPESEILPDWRGVRLYEQYSTASITHCATVSETVIDKVASESGFVCENEFDPHPFGEFCEMFYSDIERIVNPTWRDQMTWGRSLGYVLADEMLGLNATRSGYMDGKTTWLNLLQISSAGNMQWSDMGYLVFLICPEDLARRNFDSVRGVVISS